MVLPVSSTTADTSLQLTLPFNRPRISDLHASPRRAFAHWHNWPVSVDNLDPAVDWYQRNELSPLGNDGAFYAVGGRMRQRPLPRPVRTEPSGVWEVRDMEDEVGRAEAIGLDGFTLGVCTLTDGSCWPELVHMLEAANNISSDFKIIPNLDMASLASVNYSPAQVAAAIATVANAPAVLRTTDGRMVLSATNPHRQPASWWQSLRQEFANRGINIYLQLILQAYERDLPTYLPLADAVGSWGPSTPTAATYTASRVSAMRAIGKTYIAPVRSQENRPKNAAYAEARQSATFIATMQDAISGDADNLFILTWNDGEEGAEIRPSTGTQWSYYDLAAYYLTWYKLRQAPAISRDVLYYFHRIEWTTSAPDPTKQPTPFAVWYASQQAPVNEIELLAFLRAPGTLKITTSAGTTSADAPAGVTSLRAPLAPGYPSFALIRDGITRVSLRSAFNVRDHIDWQDLLYRGGSSTRPVVDMVANPPIAP